MKTTVRWTQLSIFHASILFFISFPLICANEYTVDGLYEYSIPYESSLEDFNGISTPKCGYEIEQMDVSKVKHPNQIRLSLTGDPTEMAVTWTTNSVSHYEVVNYGVLETDLNFTALSISHQYKWHWLPGEGDYKYTSGFIHESLMFNLIPGRIHYYQIESNGVSSPILNFVAAPEAGSKVPISFLHTGDVGVFGTSVMVTKTIMERMEKKNFYGMVHCGDICYANKYNKKKPEWAAQHVWDTWGQMAEPIGSKMPYMTAIGNHELDEYESTFENGTIYSKRFIMPGNERYFSFGVGMVHFVAVSTDEDIHPGSTQGVWLDRTLGKIRNQRSKWPWLVVFQHRPIYNSGANHGNWTGANNYSYENWDMPTYEGWPEDYEALLIKHDVDLVLTGHVHHYERTWPVKDRDDVTESYDDVTKPVHITCGHGGKDLYAIVWGTEDKNTYTDHHPRFSAARDNVHWGHCELEFLDEKRVRHSMFRMGESEVPAEEVVITRVRSGARRVGLDLGLILACLVWVFSYVRS